jgi:threonine aldolase
VEIDLRSDTVTKPSAAMRAAMAAAEVGDDDYRDDPTVIRLEECAAALLGKEAGLFVPSGVMSNLVAALTHCPADRRVVALANSHIAWSLTEHARIARLVRLSTVPSDARGLPVLDRLRAELDNPSAPVGLLCYENTHNLAGGTALAPAETAGLIAAARDRRIPIHLDGARLFNAAVALGLPASVLAAEADSATFCVSKGLAAPIGSILCGNAEFVERARDTRKYLGGTTRQIGIVAAAGLFALETGIERLAVDNANARWLAERLAAIPELVVTPEPVETNILFVEPVDGDASVLAEALLARGVATNVTDGRIRLVTHRDVDRPQLARAAEIVAEVVSRQERATRSKRHVPRATCH